MGHARRRIRAITWIACAFIPALAVQSARGGLVIFPEPHTSATVLISSAANSASTEILETAEPSHPPTFIANQSENRRSEAMSSLPAAFVDATGSPGTVIPLPPALWSGLILLSALAAVSALRTFRR